MKTTARITMSLVLAAASATAFAQSTTAPAAAASQATTVGVTQETAKAANEKAIKRSDVATVVRTGPTAADRARHAGDKADSSTSTSADGTSVATAPNRSATLAPRVDRN
jgi:hypothetical protein